MASVIISATKYAARVLLGITFSLFLLLLVTFLALPLLAYRWFVLNVAARFFGPSDLREGVNELGNGMALEFRNPGDLFSSRFSIVWNFVFDGHISVQELLGRIQEKWIRARGENGELMHPEFRQYFAPWMGFMFFKQDFQFNLENHIKLHTLDGEADSKSCEKFTKELNEMLLNQPWKGGKSPWEFHVVQNFNPSSFGGNSDGSEHAERKESCTLLALRIHHGLVDGFAGIQVILAELFGNKIDAEALPRPASKNAECGILEKVTSPVKLAAQMLHAMGWTFGLMMAKSTPFHIPDSSKMWKVVCTNGPVLPVSKIKMIKNQFGVSFVTVVDSVLGAAIGNMARLRMGDAMPNTITYGTSVPLPNHPRKLRNHAAGIAYEMPISPEMDPLERLVMCERNMSQIKIGPLITLISQAVNAFIAMPIHLSMVVGRNRFIGLGVSNVPAPATQLYWNKRKLVAMDVVAIPGPGVGGLVFLATSYRENLRLKASAEKAVMSREELEQMFGWAEEQFELLYQLALEDKRRKED